MNPIDFGYRRVSDEPVIPPRPEVVAEPIPGVRVLRLSWHADERGALCEIHRESWGPHETVIDRVHGGSRAFGGQAAQVYVSETEPGVVKGWHLHLIQTDRFSCVVGRVRLVLVDMRTLPDDWHKVSDAVVAAHKPVELLLDPSRSMLRVEVPPGVAHGWLALGGLPAMVVNCCSHEYDGTDEYRCDPHGRPAPGLPVYDWLARRDG